MKEEKKYIMIIHYSFHWSFAVIDNIKKKISTYDSGVQISGSHSKSKKDLKASLESIPGKQWHMKQVQVPQQDEGESCEYRMLSNVSKVIKGQEIPWERFTVIDNIRKKLNTYDSGIQISGSHKKLNENLKTSLESITEEKWQIEQIEVPQQDEGESCGYRMLSYLSKIIKGQIIHRERAKDRNRLHYYLEIAQTLKDNQIKRTQRKKRKARGKEEEEREEEEMQEQHRQKRSKQEKEKENKKNGNSKSRGN